MRSAPPPRTGTFKNGVCLVHGRLEGTQHLGFDFHERRHFCLQCWLDKGAELDRLKVLVSRRERALEEILEILDDPHYVGFPAVKESKIRKAIKLWTEDEG